MRVFLHHYPLNRFFNSVFTGFSLLAVGMSSAGAADFYVTDSTDTTNATSLRGAIIAANTDGGANIIHLSNAVYRLSIAGADESNCFSGDLNVTRGNLVICGGTNTVIDASALGDRALRVLDGAELTLFNIVITGGTSQGAPNGSGGDGENGGGIYNSGLLTLVQCVLSNNVCGAGALDDLFAGDGGDGGTGAGLYNDGILEMDYCIIEGNMGGAGSHSGYAYGNGGRGGNGGVHNAGMMTVSSCVFNSNIGGFGGTGSINGGPGGIGGSGGGIYNGATAIIENSVIFENFSGRGAQGCVYNSGSNGGDGGGIYNAGDLIISYSLVSNNITGGGGDGSDAGGTGGSGGNGGGLFNDSVGSITVRGCTVVSNSVGNPGGGNISANGGAAGGIGNAGTLNLFQSTIAANQAGSGAMAFFPTLQAGVGGNAGGIYNSGNATLDACTVSGNSAGQGGEGGAGASGLGFGSSAGTGQLGGNGGGIYNEHSLTVTCCTICLNSAGAGGAGGEGAWLYPNGGGGGGGGNGGGICSASSNSIIYLRNTLVAMNSTGGGGIAGAAASPDYQNGSNGNNGTGPDLTGAVNSLGYNVVGKMEGSIGLTNGVANDIVGSESSPVNPLVGPLQMNGGPTATHALLWGSPAIDQGNALGQPTDQRGHRRPHDYASIPNPPGGDGSDIGAFELDTPFLVLSKLPTANILSWEDDTPGYTLEFTTNLLSAGSWIVVTNTPSDSSGRFSVSDSTTAAMIFYRLRSH